MQAYTTRTGTVLDAVQITHETFSALHPNPEHIIGVLYSSAAEFAELPDGKVAELGDWIISVEGSLFVVEDDLFHLIFDV